MHGHSFAMDMCFWLLLHMFLANAEVFSQSPDLKPTITKGMLIDAGSGGSRLHIYSWKPRVFGTVPPPISYPEANERWTGVINPGVATYYTNPDQVSAHLAPLIDFAKVSLGGQEADFADLPIYFKATGGMRELTSQQRESILFAIRKLLNDKTFCPFYFRDDFARVISGEEEAVYSWAATNFLFGTLLPYSTGIGSVIGANKTYGTLDLGGASTQIAFYVPNQQIMEGMYNLQIGGQKHWNVYATSFLWFGIVSARLRHMTNIANVAVSNHKGNYADGYYSSIPEQPSNRRLVSEYEYTMNDFAGLEEGSPAVLWKSSREHSEVEQLSDYALDAVQDSEAAAIVEDHTMLSVDSFNSLSLKQFLDSQKQRSVAPTAAGTRLPKKSIDYCLHAGYSETAADHTGKYSVTVSGPSKPYTNQLELCMDSVRPLMEKGQGQFCDEVYHGECSIAGKYQPPIPGVEHGQFIGQSSYRYPWKFLMLPQTATLNDFKNKARVICTWNMSTVLTYFQKNNLAADLNKLSLYLPYYCFQSAYVLVLLHDGYKFEMNQTLTVIDEINGNSVGWALGAMMYEINEMPWEYKPSVVEQHPWGFMLVSALIGALVGGFVIFMFHMHTPPKSNRPVIEMSLAKAHSLGLTESSRMQPYNGTTEQGINGNGGDGVTSRTLSPYWKGLPSYFVPTSKLQSEQKQQHRRTPSGGSGLPPLSSLGSSDKLFSGPQSSSTPTDDQPSLSENIASFLAKKVPEFVPFVKSDSFRKAKNEYEAIPDGKSEA